MKKAFTILLALGLVLTMGVMSAVPAAAVTPGTITVKLDNPLAGELAEYTICFHNGSTLYVADVDYIDIMFPAGTDLTLAAVTDVAVGTSCATAVTIAWTDLISGLNVRIYPGVDIDKCEYVEVVIEDVENPDSCFHHLQVGSSTHTPSASDDYVIYTAVMSLTPGKNLIALPAYPEDTSIEVVLADLFAKLAADPDFEFSVWYWDSWAFEWVIYASDTSFSDLETMEAGKAYWVKVNKSIDFYFKGEPYPYCQGPPQKWCYPPSWSMIGITGTVAMDASEFLKDAMMMWPHENTYAVSTIFGFDPALQKFVDEGWIPGQKDVIAWMGIYAVPWPGPSDALLQPAEGYFMSFLDFACIIPPLP